MDEDEVAGAGIAKVGCGDGLTADSVTAVAAEGKKGLAVGTSEECACESGTWLASVILGGAKVDKEAANGLGFAANGEGVLLVKLLPEKSEDACPLVTVGVSSFVPAMKGLFAVNEAADAANGFGCAVESRGGVTEEPLGGNMDGDFVANIAAPEAFSFGAVVVVGKENDDVEGVDVL